MLFDYIRVLKDTGALSDLSIENQDDSATISISALTDSQYLYIAQRMPFTNLFINVGTVNAVSASWTVEYWDGTQWRAAVDVVDATKVSGATCGRSGIIQWSLDKDYSWNSIEDPTDTNAPTELSSIRIYDCYWIRMKPSATLTSGATLKEITYAFTASQELKIYDVEIDSYLSSFASGKTDWVTEIIAASKLLVLDFRRLGLIVHQGQLIELNDVSVPCALKTVMLIYSNLGPAYKDRIAEMKKEYDTAMNLRRFTIDENADGRLDRVEMTNTIKRLVR